MDVRIKLIGGCVIPRQPGAIFRVGEAGRAAAMRRVLIGCALALLGVACAGAGADTNAQNGRSDQMRAVDPLGGPWRPVRIGDVSVPAAAEVRAFFHAGVDYNMRAGCRGFGGTYSLDGSRIRTRQREPLNTSRCRGAATVRLETALADFMAQASTYALLPGETLQITARDGRVAVFHRPTPTIPALYGRWEVERIGGDVIAPGRQVRVDFGEDSVSAVASCNQMSARFRPTKSGFAVDEDGSQTLIGCGTEREAFDRRLFGAVQKVGRYVAMPGDRVRLEGRGELLVLRRRAAKLPTLSGTYRACGSTLPGIGYDGIPAVTFTNSTVRDSAGCAGTYSTRGAQLEIKRAGSKACAAPPAPLDRDVGVGVGDQGSVLALLRPDAYAFDQEGMLRLRTRRGVLDLCRDGASRPFGSG